MVGRGWLATKLGEVWRFHATHTLGPRWAPVSKEPRCVQQATGSRSWAVASRRVASCVSNATCLARRRCGRTGHRASGPATWMRGIEGQARAGDAKRDRRTHVWDGAFIPMTCHPNSYRYKSKDTNPNSAKQKRPHKPCPHRRPPWLKDPMRTRRRKAPRHDDAGSSSSGRNLADSVNTVPT